MMLSFSGSRHVSAVGLSGCRRVAFFAAKGLSEKIRPRALVGH